MLKNKSWPRLGLAAALFLGLTVAGCYHDKKAVGEYGQPVKIKCTEGYISIPGTPYTASCEPSGALFHNGKTMLANDKQINMPDYSAVFEFKYEANMLGESPSRYLDYQMIKQANKFEGITKVKFGSQKFAVATTAFDKFEKTDPKDDPNNTLLMWPLRSDKENQVEVISKGERGNMVSSLPLRAHFIRALENVYTFQGPQPYFKIEGLAAAPGNKLLFGIREIGRDSNDPDRYAVMIISIPYKFKKGRIKLSEDKAEVIYSYDLKQRSELGDAARFLGLSSIEYDPKAHLFYLLTSYERGQSGGVTDLGGYLWALSYRDLFKSTENHDKKQAPILVRNNNGEIVEFDHKPEGLAVIDTSTLLVIYDDDRAKQIKKGDGSSTPYTREGYETYYSIVKIQK